MIPFFLTFILVAVLVSFWFSGMPKLGQSKGTPLAQKIVRWRYPVLVFVLLAGPLLLVNQFFSASPEVSGERAVVQGARIGEPEIVTQGYADLILQDSTNLDLHFLYIQHYFKQPNALDAPEVLIFRYTKMVLRGNREMVQIGNLGLALIHTYLQDEKAVFAALDRTGKTVLKYKNYCLGLVYNQRGQADSATHFFQQEIQTQGDTVHTIASWSSMLYQENHQQELVDLLAREWTIPYVENDIREEVFFKNRNGIDYSLSLLEKPGKFWNWVGFLAGTLVALVWMTYLYRLNIFSREGWGNLLLLFGLGFIFSFAVFPLADILNFGLGFQQNGEILHDFIYCVLAIGMVEELVKITPLLLFLWWKPGALSEPFTLLLYASASALGFAFSENLLYFDESQLHIILTRALTAVLMHLFFTSTVAYGLILKRHAPIKRPGWVYLVGFFLLAAIGHGFYDFWLINEWAQQYTLFTFVIYLIGIHVLTIYQNNAINNSSFFTHDVAINNEGLLFHIVAGLLGILMVEYVALGWQLGSEYANAKLFSSVPISGYLIFFVGLNFSRFDMVQGYWAPLRIPVNFFLPKFTSPKNYVGLQLELTAHRQSEKLMTLFPVSGQLTNRLVISGAADWFVMQLHTPLSLEGFVVDKVIIRGRGKYKYLNTDNPSLVMVMLMRDTNILSKKNLRKKDFVLGGWALARKLSPEQQQTI